MSAIAAGSKASGSGASSHKNAFNVPQNQAERKNTVYYPYHRNEGYPRQMMSNFRLVKVATLKRYVRYYNVPVRPDSTPVELACAVAKHFKSELDVSGSVAGEKKVIEHFVEQVTREQRGAPLAWGLGSTLAWPWPAMARPAMARPAMAGALCSAILWSPVKVFFKRCFFI